MVPLPLKRNITQNLWMWPYLGKVFADGIWLRILRRDHLRHPQFTSFQSLSHVQLFATPWIAAHQASLSITNSWSSLRLMSIESVMPSSHLILCHPLLVLPPIPPSIRVFSNESTLCMRWPKYWETFKPMEALPINLYLIKLSNNNIIYIRKDHVWASCFLTYRFPLNISS